VGKIETGAGVVFLGKPSKGRNHRKSRGGSKGARGREKKATSGRFERQRKEQSFDKVKVTQAEDKGKQRRDG